MKERLIVLCVLLLVGCASAPKEQCTFLYTDYRYEDGKLNTEPVYRCTRTR